VPSFKKLLIFGLLVAPSGLTAQRQPSDSVAWAPRAIVKFSPLHMVGFYPTVQVAVEYRVARRVSLQTDVGVALNYSNQNADFLDRRGIKFKQDIRYYLSAVDESSNAHYLSFEYYGNFINFDRDTWGLGCFDLDCLNQFRQRYFFTVRYREQGVGLRYGLHYFQGRFDVDFGFGFLLRVVRYHKPVVPGEPIDVGFIQIPNENNRTVVRPTIGFRVGYLVTPR
jgi:hypothetical protein